MDEEKKVEFVYLVLQYRLYVCFLGPNLKLDTIKVHGKDEKNQSQKENAAEEREEEEEKENGFRPKNDVRPPKQFSSAEDMKNEPVKNQQKTSQQKKRTQSDDDSVYVQTVCCG